MQQKLFSFCLISLFSISCYFGQTLNENFSLGTLPAGWTQTSVSLGDVWVFGGGVDFGSTTVIADPDGNAGEYARIDFSTDPDTTALITPAISISGIPTAEFSFYYISQTNSSVFNPYNRLIVDYWDGNSWENITVIDSLTTNGWTQYTYNAHSYTYSTDSVKFRFAAQEGGAAIGGTGTATYDQDMALDKVYIGPPCDLTASISGSHISCGGLADGSATVSPANGTLPYTYTWNNGDTTSTISALTVGIYSVTVNDAASCQVSVNITLTEPNPLVVTAVTDSNQTCNFGGGVSVASSGGTSPYSYQWSTGDTSMSINNLTGATYAVTVTDSNGCSAADSTMILGYTDIQSHFSFIEPTCTSSGSIFVDSTQGGQPIIYESGNGISISCIGATQTTTIGTGTSTNSTTGYPAPYGNWYWGTRHQIMYRKSELNALGISGPTLLNSIAFDVDQITGTSTYLNYEIQMGATPDSNMSSWKNVSTVVFPSDTVIINTGWNTHTFTTPFFWNGEDNLIVQLCFNNSGFTNNSASPFTPTSYTSVRYYRADISSVCSNATSTTGTSSNRPNTVFTHCPTETAPYSYSWSNGSTSADSLTGLGAGTYTVTIADNYGCTFVDSITLATPFTTGTDVITACDTYTWIDGNTYTSSNSTATHTLIAAAGCDSIVTLNLTINNSTTSTDAITACDSYTWIDGNTYTTSNDSATFTLLNAIGCDSIVSLDLTINNSNSGTDVITACDSYTWIDGNTYTSSNDSATFTLLTSAGCDSVVSLDLTINNSNTGTDVITACDSYTWIDGNTYTSSNDSATFTLLNAVGCDSVVSLNLTINNSTTSTDVISTCDSYTWIDGNTYTSSNDSASFTLQNAAGCDSVISLNLTINSSNTGTDVITACNSYTWIDGNTYTSSNDSASFTLLNAAGCDSVVSLNLTINSSSIGTDVITACDSYTWIDGNTYTTSNDSASFTLLNAAGCDSVVRLDLTINTSTLGTDVITACDSYTWIDGNTYTASNDTASFTLLSSTGCDSVVTLNLSIPNIIPSVTDNSPMLTADQNEAEYQWLDCDNGYAAIAGETNQSFIASSNGTYAAEITMDGCADTTACVMVLSLHIGGSKSTETIQLFPNPTDGQITITRESIEACQVSVYNSSGQLVKTASMNDTSIQLDLSPYGRGVYQVILVTSKGRAVKKLIIK